MKANFIHSKYPGPPILLSNGHVSTIYTAINREVKTPKYTRERVSLPDGDFIDLDWVKQGSTNLVVLVHGLEGDSQRHYISSTANKFIDKQWDVLAWNARSCSGEINLGPKLYSHADIDDLKFLLDDLISSKTYGSVNLIGQSMGGNMVLKYAGLSSFSSNNSALKSVVAISTPLDLKSTASNLDKIINWPFKKKFYDRLKLKMLAKEKQYPGIIDITKFDEIKRWIDFDEFFSAPLGGFDSANDFYTAGSGMNFLNGIKIPCLILQAKNDPILTQKSLDLPSWIKNHNLFFELTRKGGHCAFNLKNTNETWFDVRSLEFVEFWNQ